MRVLPSPLTAVSRQETQPQIDRDFFMREQHPLSAAFPAMSDDDFASLKDSIQSIGVQNPITLCDDMVIDGWHRYLAATDLGMDCPAVEIAPGVDLRDFVLAQNKARRNCMASQLAAAAVKVYQWLDRGRPKINSAPVRDTGSVVEDARTGAELSADSVSASEIASKVGVSTRSVEQAKKVIRNGVHEVVEAVQRGDVSLKRAEQIASLPADQQAKALHAKPERKPAVKTPQDGEFELLQAKLKEAQARIIEVEEQRDYMADELEAALRIIRADEQLAQAWAEIEKSNKRAFEARSRVDGLMNERNAAVRRVKALERQNGRSVN